MKQKLLLIFLLWANYSHAQLANNSYRHNLSKLVTFNIKQQPVKTVLAQISEAGNFYFSYSGALFQQDSLVTMNVKSMPVRDVLEKMFNGTVDYKENAEYIILRYAVNHFTIQPDNIATTDKQYVISGFVVDTETGKKVKQASVYEKRLLESTLTDEEGYFSLKFKGEHKDVILTASKETYRDTALIFLADINVKPKGYDDPDKEKGTIFSNAIEDLGISRFFLSSKQRIQNINIPSFFANTPFQASLTPGLSSHGMMSSRVVNKVSLNVFGGYTAGVNGVEIAGLFNLTIRDASKFQAAGLFNVVGGNVEGFQLAGLHNNVKSNVEGFHAAGLVNLVKGSVNGMQLAGLGNLIEKDLKGVQAAGLGNIVGEKTKGVQFAGLGNIASKEMRGIQIAGLFNYAKNMKGFQFGLINLANTNTGTSLGLINISKNGYYKLSFYANETVPTNVAIKTGNANLYTMLIAGKSFTDTAKIATAGIGFGHDFIFGKTVSIATEMTSQYLYLGNWDYANILMKFQANLQLKLFKGFSLFGGPSYSYYNSNAPLGASAPNYKQQIVPQKHQNFSGNNQGWLGWNVGITIF